jgi:hypothetical protein
MKLLGAALLSLAVGASVSACSIAGNCPDCGGCGFAGPVNEDYARVDGFGTLIDGTAIADVVGNRKGTCQGEGFHQLVKLEGPLEVIPDVDYLPATGASTTDGIPIGDSGLFGEGSYDAAVAVIDVTDGTTARTIRCEVLGTTISCTEAVP